MTECPSVTTESPSNERLIIASADPGLRQELREMLINLGYDVVAEATGSTQTIDLASRLQPDIALIDIVLDAREAAESVSTAIERNVAPVILVLDQTSPIDRRLWSTATSGYLMRPLRGDDLRPAIEFALVRFAEMNALRDRISELEEALETRKLVERAKGILMDLHGMSESDAFRRMRKTSMDNRKTMREVAEAILLSHDLQLGPEIT